MSRTVTENLGEKLRALPMHGCGLCAPKVDTVVFSYWLIKLGNSNELEKFILII